MNRRFVLLAAAGLLLASFASPAASQGALGNPRTVYLTSNVSVTADGAFHDVLVLHLSIGTWVVSAAVMAGDPAFGDNNAVCALADGTTIVASAPVGVGAMTFAGYVVESAAADVRISCLVPGGHSTFYADADTFGQGFGLGNTVTYITAHKA